jgi:ATPase subunit of ABC transporter with duplicated ATPase domains
MCWRYIPETSEVLMRGPFPLAGDVLLELRNVYKSFGTKDILQGASMQIRRGEAVGIIGRERPIATTCS